MGHLHSTVCFPLKSSWVAFIFLSFISIGAIVSIWSVNVGLVIKLILLVIVLFYFYYALQRYILFTCSSSIIHLQLNDLGEWILQKANGQRLVTTISSKSIVSRYLIILNFHSKDQQVVPPVVLWADSVSTALHRRLRCLLLSQKVEYI